MSPEEKGALVGFLIVFALAMAPFVVAAVVGRLW